MPEVGNSRIVVYALQTLQTDDVSNAYKDPAEWKVAWTYHLKEGSVVSNMISLVSADVNQDGIKHVSRVHVGIPTTVLSRMQAREPL